MAADPEKVRARKREEARAVRAEVIAAYGGRCACCGTDYDPHLTIAWNREYERQPDQALLSPLTKYTAAVTRTWSAWATCGCGW
jgi:hypothetical protein